MAGLRVFISYAQADGREAALKIGAALDGHDVFRDDDLKQGVKLGDNLVRELYDRIERCDVVVVVMSPNLNQSKWCFAEIMTARALGKVIVPLRTVEEVSHPLVDPALLHTAVDEAGLHRLCEELQRIVPNRRRWDWAKGPPYPGLRGFRKDESAIFFGRSEEVRRLHDCLELPASNQRSLCIIGPSGSGKSSLLRAGLLPTLDERTWTVCPVVTLGGQSPAKGVAVALEECWARLDRKVAQGAALLEARWAGDDPESLVREMLRSAPERSRLLLCIDQFEQLYSGEIPEDDRCRFLRVLERLTTTPYARFYAIATLRIEHVAMLTGGWGPRLFPILPLAGARMRTAITGPAEAAGLTIDAELVDQMISDASGVDALPLLSSVLREMTFALGAGAHVQRQSYRGLEGVLERQAEVALAELGDVPRESVLRDLSRLVTVDATNTLVRRPLSGAEVDTDARRVYEAFANQRLLVTTASGGYDVAHEALFRVWEPLAETLKDAANEIKLSAELRASAQAWDEQNRPLTEHLWRGRRAATAMDWLATQSEGSVSERVLAFIKASCEQDAEESGRRAANIAMRAATELGPDPEHAMLVMLAAADRFGAPPALQRELRNCLGRSTILARIMPDELASASPVSIDITRNGNAVAALFAGVFRDPLAPALKVNPALLRDQVLGVFDVVAGAWRWSQQTSGCRLVRWCGDDERMVLVDDRGCWLLSAKGETLQQIPAQGRVRDIRFAARADVVALHDDHGLSIRSGSDFEELSRLRAVRSRFRLAPDGSHVVTYDPAQQELEYIRVLPIPEVVSQRLPEPVVRDFLSQDIVVGAANDEGLWEDWSGGTRSPSFALGYAPPRTLGGPWEPVTLPDRVSLVAMDAQGAIMAAALASEVVVHQVHKRSPIPAPVGGAVGWIRGEFAETQQGLFRASGGNIVQLHEGDGPYWPSHDGTHVAMGYEPVLRRFDDARFVLPVEPFRIGGLAADGRQFYAVHRTQLDVYDTESRRLIRSLPLSDERDYLSGPLVCSAGGRFVALPFQRGPNEVRSLIVDLLNGGVALNVRGRACSFSPNEERVATIEGEEARLTSTHNGEWLTLFATYGQPKHLAFSPDGTLVAAALDASGVLVFDVKSRERTAEFPAYSALCVDFTKDHRLLVGGLDGLYLLELASTPELLSRARSSVHRELTPTERRAYGL